MRSNPSFGSSREVYFLKSKKSPTSLGSSSIIVSHESMSEDSLYLDKPLKRENPSVQTSDPIYLSDGSVYQNKGHVKNWYYKNSDGTYTRRLDLARFKVFSLFEGFLERELFSVVEGLSSESSNLQLEKYPSWVKLLNLLSQGYEPKECAFELSVQPSVVRQWMLEIAKLALNVRLRS